MLQILPQADIRVDLLTPTIFHEGWWLDIATEGRYEVVEATQNGEILGRLPYFLRKKMGVSIIELPTLTHFLGPAIKPNLKFLRRLDITKELLRKLPPASAVYVKCHRDVQDVLAFQSAGFRSHVQFTHEIYPQPTSVLWKNLRDKARNVIRRASERYSVSAGHDPAAFMHYYNGNIETEGKTNYLNTLICEKLIRACLERDRGRIYEARDQSGNLMGAIFCAWDNWSSYYLMTTRVPDAHLGTTSLLVWEAIADAANRGLIFDFDGVPNEGGARFACNFTPKVVPRYIAVRESAPLHLFRSFKCLFKEKSFFV